MTAAVAPGFTCALCGSHAARRWRHEEGWTIVRCRDCGLARTWPQAGERTLREAYDDDTYHADRSAGWEMAGAWHERAQEIVDLLPPRPASLLDFGAGPGNLVRALREMGIACEGIEPSATARAAARDVHQIELAVGLDDLAGRSFDCVTLLHSLEHVPDPLATLRDLAGVLSAGGGVFIEVPHAGGTGMLRPAARRRILDMPLHIHHFTPATLTGLVAAAGLRVREVRLFNAGEVERLLALRASLQRRRGGASATHTTPPGAAAPSPARVRTLWREGVLPALRRVLPGDKFQVIAVRAPPPPATATPPGGRGRRSAGSPPR